MARKEKNIHYIYKTTCNVTGRYYVGMHSAYNVDDGYLGSGLMLRRSVRKYGIENHTKEILEFLETREALVLREIEIVTNELIADDLCMNLMCGGKGGYISKEHYQKTSKISGDIHAKKIETDLEYKTKFVKNIHDKRMIAHLEGKKVFGMNFSGKTHSEESKLLISKQRKGTGVGETNSQFGTCWITRNGFNKKIKKENLDSFIKDGWAQGRK